MRVILLEDHEDSASAVMAGLRLSTVAYEVHHCPTLKRAIKKIERESFDAALVDLGLPDASGTDAALAIRAAAPHLPIVVMTGESFESVSESLMEMGIQDILQKGDLTAMRIDHALRLACERQRREEDLREAASYDPLTGLVNRNELKVQLRRAISNADRQCTRAAILAIDLDGFKAVNDSNGHKMGDLVLQEMATRILGHIRAGDCAARVGGDEFVVVLGYLRDGDGAIATAQKICQSVGAPIDMHGTEFTVSASIGVALYPDHSRDGERLLEFADEAMYAIKRSGKGAVRVYVPPYPHPQVAG